MKCECGYDEFYAHQLCRHDVKVDGDNNFQSEIAVYDAETPYGPFRCVNCGKEYETLTE